MSCRIKIKFCMLQFSVKCISSLQEPPLPQLLPPADTYSPPHGGHHIIIAGVLLPSPASNQCFESHNHQEVEALQPRSPSSPPFFLYTVQPDHSNHHQCLLHNHYIIKLSLRTPTSKTIVITIICDAYRIQLVIALENLYWSKFIAHTSV